MGKCLGSFPLPVDRSFSSPLSTEVVSSGPLSLGGLHEFCFVCILLFITTFICSSLPNFQHGCFHNWFLALLFPNTSIQGPTFYLEWAQGLVFLSKVAIKVQIPCLGRASNTLGQSRPLRLADTRALALLHCCFPTREFLLSHQLRFAFTSLLAIVYESLTGVLQ